MYDSDEEISEDEVYLPKVEFELVDNTIEEKPDGNSENENEEEFAFPLFGSASETVMTVSLKEEEEEIIVNERPEAYYRASYDEDDKKKFQESALSAELIFGDLKLPPIDSWPWKVVSLEDHNAQVEKEKLRSRRRRPGTKKRKNAVMCRERRISREKEEKKAHREAQAKFKKQMYGGYKREKAPKAAKAAKTTSKPKYRTE